ncbi:MAG: hypothetical protein AABY16_02935 [Nanoarchaeota archaeon]
MDRLIAEIKQKHEFRDLPNSFIKNILESYLQKQKISIPYNKKNRKLLVKIIRAKLRKSAGQYIEKTKSKLSSNQELLKLHKSTNERLKEYEYIKSLIEQLKPQSILDLGCGLNPMAIAKPNIKYYAYDIKADYLSLVKDYFEKNKIKGEAQHEDITQVNNFPKTDVCLMLKLLDILGKNKKEIAKKLFTKLNSNNLIVSFATRTLSGKPMNRPYRRWFENLLKDLNLEYKLHRTNNEIFYVIKKNNK